MCVCVCGYTHTHTHAHVYVRVSILGLKRFQKQKKKMKNVTVKPPIPGMNRNLFSGETTVSLTIKDKSRLNQKTSQSKTSKTSLDSIKDKSTLSKNLLQILHMYLNMHVYMYPEERLTTGTRRILTILTL
jgi:hypothetical protein